jgi:hypothetical protein
MVFSCYEICGGTDFSLQARINLQRISTSCYTSDSGTTEAAITVIAACRAPLPHKFAINSTLTDHSITKCLLTLKHVYAF